MNYDDKDDYKQEQNQQPMCSECEEPMKQTGTYFILDYKINEAKVIKRVPSLECINCGMMWINGNAKKIQN